MSNSITLIIGFPFVGLVAYIGLAYAREAGKKGEAGMDMPLAVISTLIALGIAFSIGQQVPYADVLGWVQEMTSSDPRLH